MKLTERINVSVDSITRLENGNAHISTLANALAKLALYGFDGPMIDRMLQTFDCVHLPKSAAVGRARTKAD